MRTAEPAPPHRAQFLPSKLEMTRPTPATSLSLTRGLGTALERRHRAPTARPEGAVRYRGSWTCIPPADEVSKTEGSRKEVPRGETQSSELTGWCVHIRHLVPSHRSAAMPLCPPYSQEAGGSQGLGHALLWGPLPRPCRVPTASPRVRTALAPALHPEAVVSPGAGFGGTHPGSWEEIGRRRTAWPLLALPRCRPRAEHSLSRPRWLPTCLFPSVPASPSGSGSILLLLRCRQRMTAEQTCDQPILGSPS